MKGLLKTLLAILILGGIGGAGFFFWKKMAPPNFPERPVVKLERLDQGWDAATADRYHQIGRAHV